MSYMHAVKGSAVALVAFTGAVFVAPGYGGARDHFELILTVSTFLFAILAGFFTARLSSRYDRIRDAIAQEDANFLCLYQNAKLFGSPFTSKIRNHVDQYYMTAYDYYLHSSYKVTAPYFLGLYDILKTQRKEFDSSSFATMLTTLNAIEVQRNQWSVLIGERVRWGQWSAMLLLGTIIVVSVFALQVDEWYSHVATVLLATVIVLVLLLMRDLQNLRLGGEIILVESGQEVFEYIGRPRYYNAHHLRSGIMRVPEHVREYRLGTHRIGDAPVIELVRR